MKKRWQFEFHPLAAREFHALSVDLQAEFKRISELIADVGLENVTRPLVAPIRDKIWEIRVRGIDNIARALYVTRTGRRVVVLHCLVKKTQKLPPKAIKTALRRQKEV